MRCRRPYRVATAAILVVLTCSLSSAQCNRGSRGGPPSGGPNGPQNAFQPGLSLAMNNAGLYQMAQQQSMLAQQRFRQAQLARQRQQPRPQNRSGPSESTPTFGSEELLGMLAASPGSQRLRSARNEQIRQQNAARTFDRALRSESVGQLATAEKLYRRVIQIVGDSSELGRQSSAGLATITQRRINYAEPEPTARLVSIP